MAVKEFEMSEADLAGLLEASKATPAMFLSGGAPMFGTPQENANEAWRRLGDRMGFHHMTVRPTGKGDRFFTAETKDPAPAHPTAMERERHGERI